MASYQDDYGLIDKALHYFAFKTTGLQLVMANNESQEHEAKLKSIKLDKPVFITSLPRSGTTVLLDVLAKTGVFSYHTYQDMPFVFTPMIWAKFTRLFAKDDTLRERAHKDGIKINQYSPEAFEEMLFKAFWPQAYRGVAIEPWSEEANAKFDRFFIDHMKKLILRDDADVVTASQQRRYISKNNLNVTRLPYLKRLLPDCLLVIPFREPVQHALSLLKQHGNFTAMHQHNKFSQDYMAAIGHFDFGVNLKPMNFNGWFERSRFTPDSADFWLEYWCQTYQYLLDGCVEGNSEGNSEDKLFVGFEQLCQQPKHSFELLAERLSIDPQTLQQSIPMIKVAKTHPIEMNLLDQQNVATAKALYQRLLGLAIATVN